MMKKWIAFILLSFTPAWAGPPPASTQGQYDSSAKYGKWSLQAPYQTFSNLGGTKSYLDTGFRNLLQNSSFEDTSGTFPNLWTSTTITPTSQTSTIEDGKVSAALTYSSQTGGISQSITPSIQTSGVNYESSCWVNTTMTTMEVCALSGGAAVNCQTVPSSGTWTHVTSNMVGPSNGTSVGVEVQDSASSTGTAYVDDCYVGPARNLSQVSQAQDFGTISWAGTSSCSWTTSNTSSPTTLNSPTSACPNPTVTGNATAPSTKIPAIVFATMPPGTYEFTVNNTVYSGSSGGCSYRLTDGTNNTVAVAVGGGSASASSGSITGQLTYATPQTNVTINVQAWDAFSASNACGIYGDIAEGREAQIRVKYFPSQSQTAYRPDAIPASWSGTQVGAGGGWTTTGSAYGDFSAATSSNALTPNSNVARNFSCTADSSLKPKIDCTLPRAGNYLVCATASIANSTTNDSVFLRLVDGSGTVINGGVVTNDPTGGNAIPAAVCGTYNASSISSAIVFNLQGGVGAGTGSINQSSNTPITWSVVELDAPMPAPYLTGSVTSTTTGQEHIERATTGSTICTSGTCSGVTSTPGISSITWSATGRYIVNFTAGTFSVAPTCTMSGNGQAGADFCGNNNPPSTSSVGVFCNSTDGAVNEAFSVICMGPH